MDDETINKNIKLFFAELFKKKANRILIILIFVSVGFIAAMIITKTVYDNQNKYPTLTPNDPTAVVNPDDEDWPDDATKTRLYNNNLITDVINAVAGLSEYQAKNYGAIPYDYDTWKKAYKNTIRPFLSRDYDFEYCDLAQGNCRMPNQLTWKDDKLKLYFATHAICDPTAKNIAFSTNSKRVAVYMHLRGETNGFYCSNN